jgi:hypothetical protein
MTDDTTTPDSLYIQLLAGYVAQTEKLPDMDAYQEACKRWDESAGTGMDRFTRAVGYVPGDEWNPEKWSCVMRVIGSTLGERRSI